MQKVVVKVLSNCLEGKMLIRAKNNKKSLRKTRLGQKK
jgi:hypothetical protein